MMKNYSADIADAITRFLDEDDWKYDFDEERGLFRFNLSLKGKIQRISYVIDVKEDEVLVYGISPMGASPDDDEQISRMARFFCRANYGLKNGNFELDLNDGEIRFKSYIDCDGVIPSNQVIRDSIYVTARMFDRYASGIISILFTDATDKEAVQMCETKAHSEVQRIVEQARTTGDTSGIMDLIRRFSSLNPVVGQQTGEDEGNEDEDEADEVQEPAAEEGDFIYGLFDDEEDD